MKNCFELLNQIYVSQKMGHAFLIETNNIEKTYNECKKFSKIINCPLDYKENCMDCEICYQIDNNVMPSVMTIEPEYSYINKDQIISMKNKLEKNSLYINNSVYIIKNIEKMNDFAANALLKFLEEPQSNVVGFLITTNRLNVIPTIKSRCQVLSLIDDTATLMNEETLAEDINKIDVFLNLLSSGEKNILSKSKRMLFETKIDKKDFEQILYIIYYYLNNIINEFSKSNNFKELKKHVKIAEITQNYIEKMSINVNIELLFDNFVIELYKELR